MAEKQEGSSLHYLDVTDEDAELELPMSAILSRQINDGHSRVNSIDSTDDVKTDTTDRVSPNGIQSVDKTDNSEVSERWPLLLQTDSFSSNDSDQAALESADIADEDSRAKMNQRRLSRSDKRYHTADSIEQLKKDPAKNNSAIMKRLSWNSGLATEEDDASQRQPAVKCLSSESMRSSSGVSSNGSIHLSYPGDMETRRAVSLSRKSSSACSDGSVSRKSSGNEHEYSASSGTDAGTKPDLTVYITTQRMVRSSSDTREDVSFPKEHCIKRQSQSVTEFPAHDCSDKLPEFKIEYMAEEPESVTVDCAAQVTSDSDDLHLEDVPNAKTLSQNERLRMKYLLLNSTSIEAS